MSDSSSALRSRKPAEHDGRRLRAGLRLDLLHQLHRRNVGQAEVDHHAVQILLLHHCQGFSAGSDGKNLNIVAAEQLLPGGAAVFTGSHDQQLLGAPLAGSDG